MFTLDCKQIQQRIGLYGCSFRNSLLCVVILIRQATPATFPYLGEGFEVTESQRDTGTVVAGNSVG